MKAFCKGCVLMSLPLVLSLGIGNTYGASKYPDKPITLVVPNTAGGGADLYARLISVGIEKNKLLSQPIVVENRPGGSNAVGIAYVAGKKKDPYFILTATSNFLTVPLQGLTPVTYKDFTPIANLWFDDNVLITHANSKFKSVKDVVAEAKANPQKVTVGTTSRSGSGAICTFQFEKAAGVKFNLVTFTSGGELMTQILGGHIDLTVGSPGEALEYTRAKKVRLLGVLAEKRLAEIPDLPTFKEQGVNIPGSPNNRGICAPAGIPEDARKILEEALLKLSKTDIYKKYAKENMLTDAWMDSVTFGKWMEEQTKLYTELFKEMDLLKK